MKQLADGDMSAKIPATRASDEIGAMARTVIVFRDNMIERDRLTSTRPSPRARRSSAAKASQAPSQRPGLDPAGARQSARHCAAARNILDQAQRRGRRGDRRVAHRESRVNAASQNVTSAASSVEELATSISEIAGQATKSTEVAARAVSEAQRTAQTMTELGSAATRIAR